MKRYNCFVKNHKEVKKETLSELEPLLIAGFSVACMSIIIVLCITLSLDEKDWIEFIYNILAIPILIGSGLFYKYKKEYNSIMKKHETILTLKKSCKDFL